MLLQALNMKEQCVIHVINSQFMGFDGSVQNAQTMICAQYATMRINIILGIGLTESQLLVPKGNFLFSSEVIPPLQEILSC